MWTFEEADIICMFTQTKVLLLSLFTLILAVVIGLTLQLPDNLEPKLDGNFESTEYPADVAQSIRGCGATFQFRINDGWYGTIPKDYRGRVPVQPMNIPAYGYMSSIPLDTTDLGYHSVTDTLSLDQVNRALWEGADIIWYSETAGPTSVQEISDYIDGLNAQGEKILLLPYAFEGRSIPADREYAFSSWGVTQSCTAFDIVTFSQFMTNSNEFSPERDKENPPAGKLDSVGRLYPITPSF